MSATEVADFGLHPLLRKYQGNLQLVVSGHLHKWIDFAHTYGPQHYVMVSTRYDPNAYMLLEIDPARNTWRFINASLVEWSPATASPTAPRSHSLASELPLAPLSRVARFACGAFCSVAACPAGPASSA